MADCLDQILCNESSDCDIVITDENGLEMDTRFLHDGDTIYFRVGNRPGYTLNGFQFQPTGGEPYDVIVDDLGDGMYMTTAICGGEFIANYSMDLYVVDVIPDDPSHGRTLGSGAYPYRTAITISAIENPGYHFTGWYVDGVLISRDIVYDYTVTGNVTIVGEFEADEYSIVGRPNDRNLGEVTGSGIYPYGATVTLTAIPFPGSTFISWNDGDTNPVKTITVTGNETHIAIFEMEYFTVTVIIVNQSATRASEVCGIVTGAGSYPYGATVTLNASPNTGFSFVSWDDSATVTIGSTTYSFTITGNVTIIATFDDAMYTLALYSMPSNGGYTTNGITPALFTGGTYAYGTVVNALALPYTGYAFSKWSDGTLSDARTFTITNDIAQTAIFTKQASKFTLRINYDSTKGNVVIMNNGVDVSSYVSGYVYATVDEGTVLTAIVTEISPYVFSRWDDSSSEGMTRTFTMNSNIDRTVYFDDNTQYTLSFCSSTAAIWNYGHFVVRYDSRTHSVVINSTNTSVTLPNGTDVEIEYVEDDPAYPFHDWVLTHQCAGYNINQNTLSINSLSCNDDICVVLENPTPPTTCTVEFEFHNPYQGLVEMGADVYHDDVGPIQTTAGTTFFVSANSGYYLSELLDVDNLGNISEKNGTGCTYCYNSFPIPDGSGKVYYYKNYDTVNITPQVINDAVEVYTPVFPVNGNSPNIVKLWIASASQYVYAEKTMVDTSQRPMPQTQEIYNDLTYTGNQVAAFYNPQFGTPSPNPNDQSEQVVINKDDGTNACFVKYRRNCTYNIDCNHKYILKFTEYDVKYDWYPVSYPLPLPGTSYLIQDNTVFYDYSYFLQAHPATTEWETYVNQGGYLEVYAEVYINDVSAPVYFKIVQNCL